MLEPILKTSVVAEMRGIYAGYVDRTVLSNLSVILQAKEVVALAGPNGAGKSTFVRVLTGTLPPREGDVACDPGDIALVPQEIALYPWLTAKENCIAFAMMDGISRREACVRANVALEMTECATISSKKVSSLSGGYRRRVNIAVALMAAPNLLIMDEPTAGLDADAKRVVQDVMLRIRENGCGVLIVTHDFDVIEHVADRVLVLSDGKLVQDLPPEGLIASVCGNRRPVELQFTDVPEEGHSRALLMAGGIPYGASRWVFLRERSDGELGALREMVDRAGLRVAETRVREPNLADAYSILMKAEARSA